ncbi:MAG: glycosyltransferase family 9 protein [Candidatus Kapaibacteriales bacterium]
MKILIIRLTSLGDVILATEIPRLVAKLYPDSQIDFLVSKPYVELLTNNPYISHVIPYDKQAPISKHLLNMLSINNPSYYDIIIDLQNNVRSRIASFGKYSSIFRFHKLRFTKLRMVYLKYRPKKFFPIPELYKRTCPYLQSYDDGFGLEIWTKKDKKNGFYTPYKRNNSKITMRAIAIAPGAKHFTKKLPTMIFKELINLLLGEFDCKIILLGGSEESYLATELVIDNKKVESFIGKLDYLSTAEILDNIDIVVSNDSAMVHFASARRVPVVQIFGSTVPEFGFIPYRVPFEIVEMNNIECRPCTHYGRKKCPKGHFKCMTTLSPNLILRAINKLIEKV